MLLTKFFEQRSIGFAPEHSIPNINGKLVPVSSRAAVLARQYKPFRPAYGTRTPVFTGGITEHVNCESISHGAGYNKTAQDGMVCDERSSFKVGIPALDEDGKPVLKWAIKHFSRDQKLLISKRLSHMYDHRLHRDDNRANREIKLDVVDTPRITPVVFTSRESGEVLRPYSGPTSKVGQGTYPYCGPWLSRASAERHPVQNRVGVYVGGELRFTNEVRKAGKPDLYSFAYQPKPTVLRGKLCGILNPLSEVNNWLENMGNPKTEPEGNGFVAGNKNWMRAHDTLLDSCHGCARLRPEVEEVSFLRYDQVLPVAPAQSAPSKRTVGAYLPVKEGWPYSGHNLLQWHRVTQLHDRRASERVAVFRTAKPDGHGNLKFTIAKVIVSPKFEQVESRRYPSYGSEVDEVVKITMQDGTVCKVCKDDVDEYIREEGGTKEQRRLRVFVEKMQNYKLKKLPYYNTAKKTWEIRFVKARLPQLTLGEWNEEEGVIRDSKHRVVGLGVKARKRGKKLSWTEARTHCNLIIRELRRESLDASYWESLAIICQFAGGTVAKKFELETPLCILGKSRVWVSEDVADRLRAFDAGTGDDSADVFAQEYPNEFVESTAVLPVYTPTAEDVKQGYCVLEKPPELRRDDVDPNEEVAVLGEEEEEPEEVA